MGFKELGGGRETTHREDWYHLHLVKPNSPVCDNFDYQIDRDFWQETAQMHLSINSKRNMLKFQ